MNDLIVLPNPPAANDGPAPHGPADQGKSRLKRQLWRRLGVGACALALTLGAGWAIGAKFQSPPLAVSGGDAAVSPKLAAVEDTERNDIRALRDEIHALEAKLDSDRERRGEAQTAALDAKLNSLDRKIEAKHIDASNAAAKIEARLDQNDKSMKRLEAALASKPQPVPPTARIEPKAEAKPTPKIVSAPPNVSAEAAPAKTADARRPIGDYTLREVQDGVALVQGRGGGLYEVGPGDRLPGVGKVLAVDRVGRTWVVVTENGRIDGQAIAPQPRYSQRRDLGGYYFDERF
jgi:hypothetical protein